MEGACWYGQVEPERQAKGRGKAKLENIEKVRKISVQRKAITALEENE